MAARRSLRSDTELCPPPRWLGRLGPEPLASSALTGPGEKWSRGVPSGIAAPVLAALGSGAGEKWACVQSPHPPFYREGPVFNPPHPSYYREDVLDTFLLKGCEIPAIMSSKGKTQMMANKSPKGCQSVWFLDVIVSGCLVYIIDRKQATRAAGQRDVTYQSGLIGALGHCILIWGPTVLVLESSTTVHRGQNGMNQGVGQKEGDVKRLRLLKCGLNG
ncbi:hypothetical protein DFH09DRAFT_1424896 [Mycena vulgaris]|nr:hypothetical protein DFH09DRAFT_1424896 [Mycena vulgaris]